MRLTDAELIRLLAALLALLLASQAVGGLFQRWRQPRVVGEILAGVLLGPMVLGAAWPAAHGYMFVPEPAAGKPLAFAFWLGLLLLMFASGQDSHGDDGARADWKAVAWLTGLGMLVPMAAGWLVATNLDLSAYHGPRATTTSFALIVAIATAVTAIPVIARIFLDLGIIASPFARVVMAVAMVEDVLLWVVLSLTLGLGIHGGKGAGELAAYVAVNVGFFAACLAFGPGLYDRLARWRYWPLATAHPASGPVVVLLTVVVVASMLDVNPIFGGFLAGRVVANCEAIAEATRVELRGLAFGLFIPVFFASVGMRFDLRAGFDVGACLAFFAFAVGVKAIATLLAGRLAGQRPITSLHLAVALNARGALGVVLATIAFDAQLIAPSFYAILIIVSLATSQLAGWWLQRVVARHPEQLALGPAPVPDRAAAGI